MAHLAEPFGDGRADAAGGAVGAYELGEPRLDRIVAPAQGIIFGVGDFRRILAVIEIVMVADERGEPLQLGGRFGPLQVVDRCGAEIVVPIEAPRSRFAKRSAIADAAQHANYAGREDAQLAG